MNRRATPRNTRPQSPQLCLQNLEERLLMAGDVGDNAPTVDFQIINDWNQGFQAEVEFHNDETQAVSGGWQLTFDAPFEIYQIWNAQIISHEGNSYTIGNVSYNSSIGVGSSINFGFLGRNGATVPTEFTFNGHEVGGEGTTNPPVVPAISINDVSITEGNSGTKNLTFTVALSEATTNAVSVQYQSQGASSNSATAGTDYTAVSGTLNFAAGEVSKTITVSIKGDTTVEADEQFLMKLLTPTNATIADDTGVATIVNDDVAAPVVPNVTINDVSVTEGNSGTKTLTFTVSLSAATTNAVSVTYQTQNAASNSATAGTDYTAKSGTLSFAAGETTKTIAVTIQGDTVVEGDEQFLVKLMSATNATITDDTGVGTILNDDSVAPVVPAISINDVSVAEGNSGTKTLTFTVSLSAATTNAVSVQYQTQAASSDSATAGTDYTAASGSLNFVAGEISKTISITILGDTTVEANEQFLVKLMTPVNATIADDTGIGTILNDDTAPAVPAISVADVSTQEGDSGTKMLVFTVSLSQATTNTVTVQYQTEDASSNAATAGVDYTAASGSLTFAAGETSKTISIAIIGDTTIEAAEQFVLKLMTPTNATLADGSATGTILNDDTDLGEQTGEFNYAEVLQKSLYFYEAQRSGDLPDDYIVEWRGDSALNDGSDVGVDLSGGYYDAGDHVKFELPMASSMTMLTWGLLEYWDGYEMTGQLDRMLEAIKWGTDWLMAAHVSPNELYIQVGDGGADHSFWGAPEVMTMDRPSYKIDAQHPGSDAAGEAAAALAAASIAFRDIDPDYADELLRHAEELFNFADTYRGKYSDSVPQAAQFYNSYSGYYDELVWSAAWLYKATGDTNYLQKAETIYAEKYAGSSPVWTQAWDDKHYGASILLADLTGGSVYKQDAERFLNFWTVGDNGNRVDYTDGGLAWLDRWGSLRYAANTSLLAFIYSDNVNDYDGRYHDFAVDQINYMLGDNPANQSYVVGFGENSPVNPHHRAASGVWDGRDSNPVDNRNILYGALVGGPVSADDFSYNDERTDYVSNEVALDYNAGFQGAIARMVMEFGGEVLSDEEAYPQYEDDEFFVMAGINNSGTNYTEIRGLLNNRSFSPARASEDLSFRYYVDLSEVYDAGFSVSDVFVQANYTQGATVSLEVWNEAEHIYYVDVDFTGTVIAPGTGSSYWKEAQVRIGLNSNVPASVWDPTNDWSYQGLKTGSSNLILATNIPVYEFGEKLSGLDPNEEPDTGSGGNGGGGTTTPTLPKISVADLSITEGDSGTTTATFTVKLSKASSEAVTVAYQTVNGTATSGSDYQSASGTLTFAAGVTSMTVQVPVLGDGVIEANETFYLKLSDAVGATFTRDQALATIFDDDAPTPDVEVDFTVNDSWGSGFVAEMAITNFTNSSVNNWVLEFDLDVEITNIWNAVIVSHTGNHYVIKYAPWNSTIGAGQSVTFGFQGSGNVSGKSPANLVLNGQPLDMSGTMALDAALEDDDLLLLGN